MIAARRRSFANHASMRVSNDRWLFGYADVVTLLFACFASLYGARIDFVPAATAPAVEVPGPVVDRRALERLQRELVSLLQTLPDAPAIDMAMDARGLTISMPEARSFPVGRAEPTPEARQLLLVLARVLAGEPNAIRVEGHTDSTPIRTASFGSNWELSTARATRVVDLLISDGGLPAGRLSAAGYGEHRPLAPNDSPEARARNRRVDIVVLDPVVAVREEPRVEPSR